MDLVSILGRSEMTPKPTQSRLQNITTMTGREPGSGSAGMEGMLNSPTGSSVSSLDTGTPRSVDALVFADHYFSHRNHRGFEAPSTLSRKCIFFNSDYKASRFRWNCRQDDGTGEQEKRDQGQ